MWSVVMPRGKIRHNIDDGFRNALFLSECSALTQEAKLINKKNKSEP